MKFGMVGDCWQPLVPKGQALEEAYLAGCVWGAHTHLPLLLHLLFGSSLPNSSPCISQIQSTKQHKIPLISTCLPSEPPGQCWGPLCGTDVTQSMQQVTARSSHS